MYTIVSVYIGSRDGSGVPEDFPIEAIVSSLKRVDGWVEAGV